MKTLLLALCLCFHPVVSHAQAAHDLQGMSGGIGARNRETQLQLTTTIVKQYYDPAASGFSLLRIVLRMTYTNTGKRPILLDKKSSLIYRSTVSKSLKAAAAKKYEHVLTSSFFDLRDAGVRVGETPEEGAFVILEPGAAHAVETLYGLNVDDCTEIGEGNLRPGKHFLQVRVATWYYLSRPEEYRERWRSKGYLWWENVTSEPMPFRVEKKCAA